MTAMAQPYEHYTALLKVLELYVAPGRGPEAYEELKTLATRVSPRSVAFKHELRRAITHDREADGLQQGALHTAAGYDEPDDDAFLRRLWTDVYPDEPVPH